MRTNKNSRGQVIIPLMALVLAAGVIMFLVFNSGRTVNEKINLVNAADAAAFSGAQMVARDLNYMAYSNRAMIANELVVGHMVSYQGQVDVWSNLLSHPRLFGLVTFFVPDSIRQARARFMQEVKRGSNFLSGLYLSAVYSNSLQFQQFQSNFADTIAPSGGATQYPIEQVMQGVAQQYAQRPGMIINVNNPDYVNSVRGSDVLLNTIDQDDGFQTDYVTRLQEKASRVGNYAQRLCNMIQFVKPSGAGGGGASGNCSASQPVDDGGQYMQMVNAALNDSDMSDWITDRKMGYMNWRILGYLSRDGSTTLQQTAQGMDWVSNDSLRLRRIISGVNVSAQSSGSTLLQALDAGTADSFIIDRAMRDGICATPAECQQFADLRYEGIKRYATLNPANERFNIVAFLSHSPCNDSYGINERTGEKLSSWNDEMTTYSDDKCNPQDVVAAVAESEVFYRRPSCSNDNCRNNDGFDTSNIQNERPNLYNPFWQARLVN